MSTKDDDSVTFTLWHVTNIAECACARAARNHFTLVFLAKPSTQLSWSPGIHARADSMFLFYSICLPHFHSLLRAIHVTFCRFWFVRVSLLIVIFFCLLSDGYNWLMCSPVLISRWWKMSINAWFRFSPTSSFSCYHVLPNTKVRHTNTVRKNVSTVYTVKIKTKIDCCV